MKTNGRLQLYPFLKVAAFLIAGIAIGVGLHGTVPFAAWAGTALVLLAACFFVHRHSVAQSCLLQVSILIVGALLADLRCSGLTVSFPEDPMAYKAVITSRPVVKGKTVRCDMTVMGLEGKTFKIKASFLRDGYAEQLRLGNGVEVFSRIEQPRNYANSTFDYRRYLLFHGYKGTAFILPECWTGCNVGLGAMSVWERAGLRALVFRDKLLARYAQLGSIGQDYAVLSAMTLGDKTAISAALADDYSVSGAAHVLALSGLHLGIIFTVLTFVFSRLRFRSLSLALVALAIWTYVFIVGMSPSVMRSAVMLTVYSFVSLLNRNSLSLNTLSLAAVVLLVANPLYLYDVGFQMSFLSVLFILLLYRPLHAALPLRWRRIKAVDYVWQMACVSLSAQLGVAPLVAFYFGRFSCYFLITNFLVIPMATLILYGAALMALTSLLPSLQGIVAVALFRLTGWLNSGVSFISSLPGASIENIRINALQTVCCYVFIAAVCILLYCLRRMFWFSRRPLDDYMPPQAGRR